jgi:hypothetical protein
MVTVSAGAEPPKRQHLGALQGFEDGGADQEWMPPAAGAEPDPEADDLFSGEAARTPAILL